MTLAPLRFAGEIRCETFHGQALSLVLHGTEAIAGRGEAAALEIGFTSPRLPAIPGPLRDARVEELAPSASAGAPRALRRFAVTASGGRRFEVEAHSVHVHRDARGPFFAAVPTRRAPLGRRMFFHLAPALVATRFGRGLLRQLRGR